MSRLLALFTSPNLVDVRRRVLFTLAVLAAFRVGVYVTIPGVDRSVMQALLAKQGGGLLGLFNLFSGGALGNLSVFSLGIMPYVSASIVMQLLGMVYKPLEELRREGEAGMRKINQWTRYGALGLAIFQSMGAALQLEGYNEADMGGLGGAGDVVLHPGWGFRLATILTLTTGTALIMWMGEQITERGIGNGTSLIIFAGIVTDIPGGLIGYFQTNKGNIQPLAIAAVATIILATVSVIIFFERGQRRIPIHYARRSVGRRVFGAPAAHLPLKVNTAGTIPPIFASSLLMFPATLANYRIPGMQAIQGMLQRGDWLFNSLYAILIIFFCYFYTAVTFQAVEVADNLKKQQAFIPNIRQGKATADYIDYVLTRVTLGGSLYVAAVCIIPTVASEAFRIPFRWGGTSLMIVVGVALDTASQLEAYLLARDYEGVAGGGSATRLRAREVTP